MSSRNLFIMDSWSLQVSVLGRVTAAELEDFFGFDHVSNLLLGEGRGVQHEHESCRGVDEEMHVIRHMELLMEFSTQPFGEDLIACAAQRGLRPATKNELYWFLQHRLSLAERYGTSRLRDDCSALALGTSIEVNGCIYVAKIVDDDECGLFFEAHKLAKEYPSIGARQPVLFVHV